MIRKETTSICVLTQSPEAKIIELKSTGELKSITMKESADLIDVKQIGSLKMRVFRDDQSETAATTIISTGSGDMSITLTGVMLENLATSQICHSIKVASKAWKENSAKAKFVSLGGIGKATAESSEIIARCAETTDIVPILLQSKVTYFTKTFSPG